MTQTLEFRKRCIRALTESDDPMLLGELTNGKEQFFFITGSGADPVYPISVHKYLEDGGEISTSYDFDEAAEVWVQLKKNGFKLAPFK